jgi:hypothetical protein
MSADRITENWRPIKRTGLSWVPWAFVDWVMRHLGALYSPDGSVSVTYGESEGIALAVDREGVRRIIIDIDDTYKVKVHNDDSKADFLHDKMADQASYQNDDHDVLVYAEATVNGTEQKLRLFLDDPTATGLRVSRGKLLLTAATVTDIVYVFGKNQDGDVGWYWVPSCAATTPP